MHAETSASQHKRLAARALVVAQRIDDLGRAGAQEKQSAYGEINARRRLQVITMHGIGDQDAWTGIPGGRPRRRRGRELS